MTSKSSGQGSSRERRWELDRSKSHLGAEPERKASAALLCEHCGVVLQGGRWSWIDPPPEGARRGSCPACTRIRERKPAGTIRLRGEDFATHQEEIAGLARNQEELERPEHPLERMIQVQATPDGLILTTTGVHLARRIANGLERRFHRQARIRYPGQPETVHIDFA